MGTAGSGAGVGQCHPSTVGHVAAVTGPGGLSAHQPGSHTTSLEDIACLALGLSGTRHTHTRQRAWPHSGPCPGHACPLFPPGGSPPPRARADGLAQDAAATDLAGPGPGHGDAAGLRTPGAAAAAAPPAADSADASGRGPGSPLPPLPPPRAFPSRGPGQVQSGGPGALLPVWGQCWTRSGLGLAGLAAEGGVASWWEAGAHGPPLPGGEGVGRLCTWEPVTVRVDERPGRDHFLAPRPAYLHRSPRPRQPPADPGVGASQPGSRDVT